MDNQKSYLLIDTAEGTRALLSSGGKYYYGENLKNSGSETLMPMIDRLLTDSGAKLAEIDVFGVCVGPGSFTGLRIGLTTVKTFCYTLGKRCFAVNNLRLNSYNNSSAKVISVADAGNKVCYVARYDGDTETDGAVCMTLDDTRKFIAEHPDHAVSTDLKLASVFGGTPGAGERELKLAAEKFIDSAVSERELVPLYIRKAQPERGVGDL